MKKPVFLVLTALFAIGLTGCGDDDAVYFWARFTIGGTEYSLEKGASGTGMDGLPAANSIESPGLEPMGLLASKDILTVGGSTETNGCLYIEINGNCTNTNTYLNVNYHYYHPGVPGVYTGSTLPITITELGPAGSGVVAGTFQVTLTNSTAGNQLTLQGGSFRLKRLPMNTLPTSF